MATALNRGLRSGIRLLAAGAEASKPGKRFSPPSLSPSPPGLDIPFRPIRVSSARFASIGCWFSSFALVWMSIVLDPSSLGN
ncbi:hypothetical protein PR202_ga20301 [Eleusine coracana subsp. coracana]|uniref:Uncharacterized protein n=1 Tax=Eleusine coracana subsp. coracana TaxID=191504 RepID=A0AAV5CWA2_ELECO|nr:hypothetical protein PR202_ga20301 [Eleusine coracana subsp. coracana]